MAKFVQIMEFDTSRADELRALAEEFRARRESAGDSTVARGTFCVDRDRPNHYVNIIEFESYDAAMENSSRTETSEFAAKLAALCDGPPKFHNLDVQETWE